MSLLTVDESNNYSDFTGNAVVYTVVEPVPENVATAPEIKIVERPGWKVFIESGHEVIPLYVEAILDSIKPETTDRYVLELLENLASLPDTKFTVLYHRSRSMRHHVTEDDNLKDVITNIAAPEGMANWHRYYRTALKRFPTDRAASYGWYDSAVEALAVKYIQHGPDILVRLQAGKFIECYHTHVLPHRKTENYVISIHDKPVDCFL